MQPIPTQDELTQLYLDLAVSVDNTNDVSQYSDYQNKGKVIGGVASGVAQDSYNLYNNVYPQYANEQGIDILLSSAGVPGIYPATHAILQCTCTVPSGKTFNVPLGTLLTAPNGATYSVIGTEKNLTNIIINILFPIFYVISLSTGKNTTQTNGTILTISPPIVSTDGDAILSTVNVTNNTDGADQETLAHATSRLIEIKQVPLCGTRRTDFYNLATKDNEDGITDAKVLINNQLVYTSTKWTVGIYLASRTPVDDYILNQGLLPDTTEVVYDRSVSPLAISNTQKKIDNEDIIGAFPMVNTLYTQGITTLTGTPNPFFRIAVRLSQAYQLDTQVTLSDGAFSISQLIKREVRRAICEQPFGASLIVNPSTGAFTSSYLAISNIEQQLDNALGTANTAGYIGSYILDRVVYTWNGTAYVYNPTLPLNLNLPIADNDGLGWIYDISVTVGHIYNNISVVLS
jgi:hypothetical protein